MASVSITGKDLRHLTHLFESGTAIGLTDKAKAEIKALSNPRESLAEDYQMRSLSVAKRRLHQAGARLAWVLNEAFPE